jgi:pentatricopeptide repeat protein
VSWYNIPEGDRKDIRAQEIDILFHKPNRKDDSKESLLIHSLFFKALWSDNKVITKQHLTEIIDKLDKTLVTKHGVKQILHSISKCFLQCPKPFADKIINSFLDAGDYQMALEYYNMMLAHADDYQIYSSK